MALIYQPSKRIFCGWFEPLKSTTYSEYPFVHAGTFEELDKSGLQPELIADALSTFINQAVLQLVSIPKEAREIEERFQPKRNG